MPKLKYPAGKHKFLNARVKIHAREGSTLEFLNGITGEVLDYSAGMPRVYFDVGTLHFVSRCSKALDISFARYVEMMEENDDEYVFGDDPDECSMWVLLDKPEDAHRGEFVESCNNLVIEEQHLEVLGPTPPANWPPVTDDVYKDIKKEYV